MRAFSLLLLNKYITKNRPHTFSTYTLKGFKQTKKQTKNVKDEINREYIIQTYQIIKFDS